MTAKQKRKIARIVTGTLNTLFKVFVGFLFLFPFYWMAITSVKPYLETLQFPPTLWPKNFTWSGYQTVFRELNIWMYIKNTIIVTGSVMVIQIFVDVPAAYSLSWRPLWFRAS